MAYQQRHRHMGSNPKPPQKFSLLIRLLSGLLGLSLGFIGGQMWATPFKPAKRESPSGGTVNVQGLPPAGAPLGERIAAVGRMDEDTLNGVLAAIQEEWVRPGDASANVPLTMLHLRMLFSRWTDLSGASALKAALQLQNHAFGNMAIEAVMTEWGLRDSLSASQSLSLIPHASSRELAALALVRSGVKRSPPEGFAIASRTPFLPANILRAAAGAEWMRRDAMHALRYFGDEPGITGTVPSGIALGAWLLTDPSTWLNWYRTGKNAKNFPLLRILPAAISPGRLTRLGATLAKEFENADNGLSWLNSTSGPYALPISVALTKPDQALAAEMKFWDANRAAVPAPDTISGWLPRARHARMLQEILPRLAAADPPGALRALTLMTAEDGAARLAPEVAAEWIKQAPSTASTKIFSGDLTHPVAKAAASTAVDELISSDPLQALDSLARLPLEKTDIDGHRADAFHQLSLSRPADMLDWLTKHPETTAPEPILSVAVKNLASADASRAQDWVQRSAPVSVRPGLTGIVFEVQLRSDRESALAFLSKQAPGPGRDAILASLSTADIALSRRDTNFAGNLLPDCFALALQITADTQRIETLRHLLAAMKETGVPSAASLANPALRPADRTTLTR